MKFGFHEDFNENANRLIRSLDVKPVEQQERNRSQVIKHKLKVFEELDYIGVCVFIAEMSVNF